MYLIVARKSSSHVELLNYFVLIQKKNIYHNYKQLVQPEEIGICSEEMGYC